MTQRGKVILLILVAGAVLAILFSSLLVYSVYYSSPAVAENSVLELKLTGGLAESAPPSPTARLFSATPTTLKSVLDNIEKAKVDKRIKGLLLVLDNVQMGFAKMAELRAALTDFKKSGKPIFAYMETCEDGEYYLALTADKIYVSPAGAVGVNGFAANPMFIHGLLTKLKVEANVERHGKYKSAGDTYTRDSMSEADREQLDALLDDLYQDYVQAIAQARNKDVQQVQQLIDAGPYANARKAADAGLIDGAFYIDQVKEQVKQQLKMEKYVGISASKYSNVSGQELGIGKGEKIAIIYASGIINSGKSNSSPFGGTVMGSDTIAAAIKKAREDKEIKAIILRIDSPGGSALASDIIWREVNLAKKEKPLIASMSDVAASGGYYIAMAADKIVAEPGTITGSIGVVLAKFNLTGLYHDHLGINIETIKRGRNADFLSNFRGFDDEERAKANELMMSIYQDFIGKAAEGRKMSVEAVDAVAQGRVWSGADGKEHGLVDELGGLTKAIELAKQMAKLPPDSSPQLIEYPKSPSLLEELFGEKDQEEIIDSEATQRDAIARALNDSLPADLRETMATLAILKGLEQERIIAFMPYTVTFK
ncbi:MAG: signal peptide peptidase SppA [Acidobacteriota bacterium]